MLALTPAERRDLRAKAHRLHPVVSVGHHGLTPAVLHEIDVNLLAHELIKVRVFADDRGAREALVAQTTFPHTHPSLPGHFPGRPIVPGVLLLASVEEMLRQVGLRVVECKQAKFLAPVLPDQVVTIRVDFDQRSTAHFEIVVATRIVVSGSLGCADIGGAP